MTTRQPAELTAAAFEMFIGTMPIDSPTWIPVSADNLVRHKSGTYFLQAKVSGRKVRKSLGTDNLRQAKVNRDVEIDKLKREVPAAAAGYLTLGAALGTIEAQVMGAPDHKKGTKIFYGQIFPLIRKFLPLDVRTSDWSKDAARAWWATLSKGRNGSQCNICLHTVRRAMKGAVEAGVRTDDPTAGIKRKRTSKPAVEDLPGMDVLEDLLDEMREGRGKAAANVVEFLAWSGIRIGELREVTWEDVGEKWLTVTGGEDGTKNHEVRRVPINSRLRDLIGRLQYEGAEGKIFPASTPRKALNLACGRIGIRRLRIHDLRHWFATHCIERGVDIPTVSKWLGHKDGGALAMRVYGHLRDEHSLQAARRLG